MLLQNENKANKVIVVRPSSEDLPKRRTLEGIDQ